MAESFRKWLGVPGGWSDVLRLTVRITAVAFLSLLLKEYLDSGEWDVPACLVDGACVGGGTFVLNALLKIVR